MSLLSIDQLSRDEITSLFKVSQHMESGHFDRKTGRNKILLPLFFEPSTRTRLSFETAMLRLGGQVLPVPTTAELSISKGESFRDTLKVLSSFGDLMIMRHPEESAVYLAAEISAVPVINCGNGCDEHPTQTLLDLYTIQKEKGKIDHLNIALVGDLKHARTMHSLIKGLSHYEVTLFLLAPEELRTPDGLLERLDQRKIPYIETPDLREVISDVDVVYIVMLQHHRISDRQVVERLQQQYYRITPELLRLAKPDVLILHPLVRRDEVSPEIDTLPNAGYFRQAQNGVVVRMALLHQILSRKMSLSPGSFGKSL